MLHAITRVRDANETYFAAGERRECELRTLFCALSPAEALTLQRRLPDVVLYEWRIIDGVGLARRLRRAFHQRRIAIIALSTQSEPNNFSVDEGVAAYNHETLSRGSVAEGVAS